MKPYCRLAALAGAAALTLSLVTACGDDDSASGGGDKIEFGYIGDFNGTSLLAIANAQGLWQKAGLDVETKVFTDGPTQITALDAGDLDFGYIGPGAIWEPASGHGKIIAINSLGGGDRVIAQPGITSLAQLKGKKIAVPTGTSGDMIVGLALKKAGLTTKDVQIVPMDATTIVTAFASGQVDAAGIWYPTIDTIKQQVPDLVELADDDDFSDSFAFPTAFVASNSEVQNDPETVTKVDAVLREAMDWRATHLEEAAQEVADMTKQPADAVLTDAKRNTMLTSAQVDKDTQDGTVDKWLNALTGYFTDAGKLTAPADPSSFYLGDQFVAAGSSATSASASTSPQ